MDELMSEVSVMSPQMISPDSSNVTSSPALVVGRTLLDSQAIQKINQCGLEVVPASRTQSGVLMAERRAKAIAAISGRNSQASSKTEILQSSLESRLRARFPGVGGIGPRANLKAMITPLGRSYSALIPLAPITKEKGSTGWPTPAARDGRDISRSNAFLSQRQRHSPSMATRLLERGAPWTVISAVYCNGISVVMERSALKGYGNAIVPQVAAEFIKAFLEVT